MASYNEQRNNKQELLLDKNKEYHCFFSYSSQDESLIIPILEILESEPYNLKCCVDRRDFMLGETTIDNIYHALNHSMGTVFFLTPQFLESDYCSHEKQTAFTMYMEGECRVIPVILKPCLVPDEFRNIHYIDESVPEVIAEKIYKCLKVDPKDFKKQLPLNPIQAGQRRINGNRLPLPVDKMLQDLKVKNSDHSFLTSHQKREFQRIGIKVCDSLISLLNMIIHIPANKPHYTNHRKKYFLCATFSRGFLLANTIILLNTLFIGIWFHNIIDSIQQRGESNVIVYVVGLFLPLICVFLWGCLFVPVALIKRYFAIKQSYSNVCKVNKLAVLDKECCFGIKVSMCGSLTVWIIKYDIRSCKTFLENRYTQAEEDQDVQCDFEEIWETIVESDVFDKYFQALANETLPHVNEERHVVFGEKICFCQYHDLHHRKSPSLQMMSLGNSADSSNLDDRQLLL